MVLQQKSAMVFLIGLSIGLLVTGFYFDFFARLQKSGSEDDVISHYQETQIGNIPGGWGLKFNEIAISEEGGVLRLYLAWPENAVPEITAWIEEEKRIFEEESRSVMEDREIFYKETGEYPNSLVANRFLTFEVPFISEELISYRFILEETGGGTGDLRNRIFILKRSGEKALTLLTLKDIFVDPKEAIVTIATLSKEQMISRYGKSNLFLEGLEPTPENYQNIGLGDFGFMVYFDKYRIAPGSSGSLSASIPFESVCPLVRDSFSQMLDRFHACLTDARGNEENGIDLDG